MSRVFCNQRVAGEFETEGEDLPFVAMIQLFEGIHAAIPQFRDKLFIRTEIQGGPFVLGCRPQFAIRPGQKQKVAVGGI